VTTVYDVAVVGSSGFLGAAIADGFEKRNARVARFTRDAPVLLSGAIDERAAGARTVVWAASHVNPVLAVARPELVAAERAEFLDAMSAFATLRTAPRVVFLSSGGTIYGPPDRAPYAEGRAPHPVNAYGALKSALEARLRSTGLEAVALRVSNAYGPGQVPAPGQGVIAHWLSAALRHEPITVYGDWVATRDYVFIDDVVEAVVRAHELSGGLPPALNIGSGAPSTLNDVLAAVRAAVGADRLEVRVEARRETDTSDTWLDVSLARSALGWNAKVALAEGVESAWAWLQTR
jgi:UDP-glucose 4-epimerase